MANESEMKRGQTWTTNFSGIRLEEFRGFVDSGNIPLKPITFLVGKNSSGKSSILKAIAAFSQTVNSNKSNRKDTPRRKTLGEIEFEGNNGDLVDIGGYTEIIHSTTGNPVKSIGFPKATARNFKITFSTGTNLDHFRPFVPVDMPEKNIGKISNWKVGYEFSEGFVPNYFGYDENLDAPGMKLIDFGLYFKNTSRPKLESIKIKNSKGENVLSLSSYLEHNALEGVRDRNGTKLYGNFDYKHPDEEEIKLHNERNKHEDDQRGIPSINLNLENFPSRWVINELADISKTPELEQFTSKDFA